MHSTMTDSDLKSFSLNMWANHIETGHVGMSASDARNQIENVRRSPAEMRALGFSVKELSPQQQELVGRLRTLARAEQAGQRIAGLTGPNEAPDPQAGSFLRSRARSGG